MRVLVAPDKFKGSLTAAAAAAAIGRGFAAHGYGTVACPIADGGDGTVDAAVAAGFTRVPTTAAGPLGAPVDTSWARDGDTAVAELADVCGLVRLPGPPDRRTALAASSTGLGEVVREALGAGARRVVLGIGGSASTDGGAGLAQALGAVLRSADGAALAAGVGGGRLTDVASSTRPDLPAGLVVEVACDVDNPLLGPHGAAAVYGPQKGADESAVAALDAALAHWARVVGDATGSTGRDDEPGAGAAGGLGFGLAALLGARLRSGFDLVADLLGFDDRLAGADLVVTGEGRLDAQTLRGKGPAGVAARARAAGLPVAVLAGRIDLTTDELAAAGIVAAGSLADLEPDPERSREHAAALLERRAAALAQELGTTR